MRKLWLGTAAAVCAVGLWAVCPADAATVTITNQVFTGNAPVEDTPTPASHTGIFSQNVSGTVPFDRLSPYAFNTNGTTNASYSILSENSAGAGSATYNINNSTWQFLWGSPDGYNIVTFWSGDNATGSILATFNGTQLTCYPSTCQDTSFDLTTFTASSGLIGSVVLSDTGNAAFEYAMTTPLPATLPLFAGGLGFVGYLTRRRKRSGAAMPAAA